MPEIPVLTPEEREKNKRWEHIIGKEIKDWCTQLMIERNITRAEARDVVLINITNFSRKPFISRKKIVTVKLLIYDLLTPLFWLFIACICKVLIITILLSFMAGIYSIEWLTEYKAYKNDKQT